ncbi:unnamed protein product [Discosporangium mesarthrocarpum]
MPSPVSTKTQRKHIMHGDEMGVVMFDYRTMLSDIAGGEEAHSACEQAYRMRFLNHQADPSSTLRFQEIREPQWALCQTKPVVHDTTWFSAELNSQVRCSPSSCGKATQRRRC